MSTDDLPLSHIKVLDLTRVRAGPACVRQFADWGADCIKIEITGDAGDGYSDGRHLGDFQNLHRNKRSMKLNLKAAEGRRIFLALAKGADVIVENYRPDVKNRLGIGYEDVAALNPRIIYASISGFGQDGPYSNRPGVDQIAQGMSGLMSITGAPGEGPMRAGAALGDMSAGIFAALGIMMAIIEREKSGKGQWLHTSLLEALTTMLDFQAAAFLFDGKIPGQAGNNHPKSIPTGAFKTKDGYLNIGAAGDVSWARLGKALKDDTLFGNPDYASGEGRLANRDAVNNGLEKIFMTMPTSHWVQLLNDEGIPCGPIYAMDQVFDDPQMKHLGLAVDVDHPLVGKRQLVGQPIHMSRTPWKMRSVTPEGGEHTREILQTLGYRETEIDKLYADGVV
ncbi:MAG: CoA transferase [Beijerinckiaceae bacterium]|jgi:crotonobetainyl-CoA:carnitine CoA-transferase CaiB-like acyl-CoA transferase|nr:CoA transferase [Beijerinckiaceae bacterium]